MNASLVNKIIIYFVVSLLVVCSSPLAYSDDNAETESDNAQAHEAVRIYRNPEERREAGFGTPINDWLTVSGLFEIEKIYKDDYFTNNRSENQDEPRSHTLQFGFEAEFSESLSADFVFEAEYQNELKTKAEEAVLKYDLDDWGFELGYQDLPFGEYYSHFVTGPLLEFGETTGTTLIVDYSINDYYDIFGYIFDGKTRRPGKDTDLGWGIGIEFNNKNESIWAGAGYLSNLAESDELFLQDSNNIYINKVPAWNIYALLGFEQFELTAEYLSATKSFAEFDANKNKPASINVELAWFINHSTQLAFRIENTKEFSKKPRWQYGIAATWRISDRLSISAEYLRGDYKSGFVIDDDDQELDNHHQYGLQMSFEF